MTSPSAARAYLERILLGDAPPVLTMTDGPSPDLEALLPGISRLMTVGHGPFFHFESPHVWGHTLHVVSEMHGAARRRFDRPPTLCEAFAALTHDIAKPDCRVVSPEGAAGFPGHEQRSADYVAPRLAALGFDEDEEAAILFMIREHGRVWDLSAADPADLERIRASRFLRSIALLQEADARACWLDRAGEKRGTVWFDDLVGDSAGNN